MHKPGTGSQTRKVHPDGGLFYHWISAIIVETKDEHDAILCRLDQFKPNTKREFDATKLSGTEMETLNEVLAKFKNVKTSEIIELSHKEEAWEKNFKSGKKLISYIEEFKLVNL